MNRGADGGGKEMGLAFPRSEVPSTFQPWLCPCCQMSNYYYYDLLRQLAAQILKKTYIHRTTAGTDYKRANTQLYMQSHKTINILKNYSTQQT